METKIRLYRRESKNGKSYISGLVKSSDLTDLVKNDILSIAIFKNEFKKTDRDPDYNLLLRPYVKKDKVSETPKIQELPIDDIPF